MTLAALLAGLLPRAAAACAVCTSGRDEETQLAFLLTTLFLSVLPLALVGGFVGWLVRRSRSMRLPEAPSTEVSRASSSP